MPPRGRPTLVGLSLVTSSSVALFSSASSCDAAACRWSLVLAASFAFFRRNSVLLAAYPGPSSLSSSPRARTTFLTPTPIIAVWVSSVAGRVIYFCHFPPARGGSDPDACASNWACRPLARQVRTTLGLADGRLPMRQLGAFRNFRRRIRLLTLHGTLRPAAGSRPALQKSLATTLSPRQ